MPREPCGSGTRIGGAVLRNRNQENEKLELIELIELIKYEMVWNYDASGASLETGGV